MIARILERLARDEREFTKTGLQIAVGLNYTVFRQYLDWLVGRGLLSLAQSGSGKEIVRVTVKGREVHRAVIGWVREIVGDEDPD